ncbi:unnamed protein product [Ixodes pacificus]
MELFLRLLKQPPDQTCQSSSYVAICCQVRRPAARSRKPGPQFLQRPAAPPPAAAAPLPAGAASPAGVRPGGLRGRGPRKAPARRLPGAPRQRAGAASQQRPRVPRPRDGLPHPVPVRACFPTQCDK